MENLASIETSITKLSEFEYNEFREWFWQHENERWDNQIEKDIEENKLDNLSKQAIEDFKQA